MNPTRRNFVVAAGGTAATALIATEVSCGANAISIAVGLLGAAAAVVQALATNGTITGNDAVWALDASKFVVDASTELLSQDTATDKVLKTLALYTQDFQGAPIPSGTNTAITVAFLAIQTFIAFLRAQHNIQAANAARVGVAAKKEDNMVFTGKNSGTDDKILHEIVGQMRSAETQLK